MKHIPVLLDEVIETFKDIEDGYIVDCTTGLAGHSKAILESNPNIKLICIDRDINAIEIAKRNLADFLDRVEFANGEYSKKIVEFKDREIRGILADIGVSSMQLDEENRGFGFNSDKLDMRMNPDQALSASEVVNSYTLLELEKIFKEYGEIREYKKVARVICDYRKDKKIESNIELSRLIEQHIRKTKLHPATLAFQAIRIEVNSELEELEGLLEFVKNQKPKDTTVAIISFHSLEDKIVKNAFRDFSKNCICATDAMKCTCSRDNALGKVITKKPMIPTKEEIKTNPRSRSSKMRIFQTKA